MSLANRYRPRFLPDLIGQSATVQKIRGQLQSAHFSPTLLISGPYGTGKTTTARMIARYLNCQDREGDRVCSERGHKTCGACAISDEGSIVDYTEINCGDTRGIDAIRETIENSTFAPRFSYRVINLDEAQELTKQAIQALLKPLEEPSPRTVWILCTTARDRISPTIRSRCFDLMLRQVPDTEIRQLIQRVSAAEYTRPLPDAVVQQISEAVGGHPRAALAALEGLQSLLSANPEATTDSDIERWLLDNVVASNPHLLVGRFLIELFSGRVSAIRVLDGVQDADQFLQACVYGIQATLVGLGGSKRITDTADKIIQGSSYLSLKGQRGQQLADILGYFLLGLQQARSGTDPTVSLDQAALRSLAVTTGWVKASE